ncbi:hypothetical protein AB1K62_14280 [Parasphingorhabdus sp. JC815]|uniref:hypothetical protein n=1 Tax=Parasphingorhabdus sp. JC815 TaxID=3232140 RepID=UPI003459E1F1
MPALLLRFLPYISAVGLVLGAIWYMDHKGYQRAQKDAKFERMVTAIMIERYVSGLETDLRETISDLDRSLAAEIDDIEMVQRTIIQPTIEKEIRNDPRFSDNSLGITDIMRGAINRARSESACPSRINGGDCVALPAPAAAVE